MATLFMLPVDVFGKPRIHVEGLGIGTEFSYFNLSDKILISKKVLRLYDAKKNSLQGIKSFVRTTEGTVTPRSMKILF